MTSPHEKQTQSTFGTLDGTAAPDHDVAYCFGRRPDAITRYPCSTRQYTRLLVLRSLIEARRAQGDERGVSQTHALTGTELHIGAYRRLAAAVLEVDVATLTRELRKRRFDRHNTHKAA